MYRLFVSSWHSVVLCFVESVLWIQRWQVAASTSALANFSGLCCFNRPTLSAVWSVRKYGDIYEGKQKRVPLTIDTQNGNHKLQRPPQKSANLPASTWTSIAPKERRETRPQAFMKCLTCAQSTPMFSAICQLHPLKKEKPKKVVKTTTSEWGITFSLCALYWIEQHEVKVFLVLLLWKVSKKGSVCAAQL